MQAPSQIVRDCLLKLSERDLQSQIVEPLLRATGFDQVRDVSGPYENGKDLVATKTELGVSHFYAIQIKKLKITGKAADTQHSLMALLTQLKQAVFEPVFDPFTQTSRVPDRLIFITPFVIDSLILDRTVMQRADLTRNQVTLIDGAMLADLTSKTIPGILATLQDDIGYRLQLSQRFSIIRESKAFGVDELPLDAHYVEMDYSCLDSLKNFLKLLHEDLVGPPPPTRGSKGRQEGHPTGPVKWLVEPLGKQELLTLQRLTEEWSPGSTKGPRISSLFSNFLSRLSHFLQALSCDLERLGDEEVQPETARNVSNQLATLQATMDRALRLQFLKKRHIVEATPEDLTLLVRTLKSLDSRNPTTYRHLSRITGTIIISGAAGVGKTTLMTKLLLHVAEGSSDFTPVFLRAIDIRESSTQGVFQAIVEEMGAHGKLVIVGELLEMMSAGEILLIVDGLDEAGDRLTQLKTSLERIVESYPESPLFISCRDTVDLSDWRTAVHVKLHDFSADQLLEFIEKWFAAQPSSVKGIREHLDKSPEIQDIARRPIIAALLCSLFDVNADIPGTECELYEARAELLLGRWEQAKGIPPMRRDSRDRYLLFLMELAYEAHSENLRSFPSRLVHRLASHYYQSSWNRSVDGFIKDCVSRTLLFSEDDGRYSFGHLTYQEFFAAKFMAHHNDVRDIARKLGLPWWRKTLEFYASLQLNISPLLRHLVASGLAQTNIEQVKGLAQLAPLTDSSLYDY